MKIKGIEGMTGTDLSIELQQGAKFVVFQYCVSVIFMTFKRPSDIYYIRPGENAVGKGLLYSLISVALGWWGIPWGPIYTIESLVVNFRGGKNVTQEVLASIGQTAAKG